jgi:hypothetical protein
VHNCNLYLYPSAFTGEGLIQGTGLSGVNVSTAPPLCAPPPARVPPSLVVGAVSPCVQRWAARWQPPPALGGGLLRSWRVLTLLWGGGRGAVRAGGGCAAWGCRVCVCGRAHPPPTERRLW